MSTTDNCTTGAPVELRAAIATYLQHCERKISAGSVTIYRRHLYGWLKWRDLHTYPPTLTEVSIDELRAYLDYLRTEHIPHSGNTRRPATDHVGVAPETLSGVWRVIRGAWSFWTMEGLLTDAQTAYFTRKRIPIPQVPRKIRPTYDTNVLAALLGVVGQGQRNESAARSRAIIMLLYDTGMRVSELCDLRDEDMDHTQRQAIVTGKGNKQRYVFWTERTTPILAAYLSLRIGESGGPFIRGTAVGGKGSENRGLRVGSESIRHLLERHAVRAECALHDNAKVHAFRHTFAHRFLDGGGDGLHLQQLMGHESLETTQRYVKENPTGLRRVYRRVIDE